MTAIEKEELEALVFQKWQKHTIETMKWNFILKFVYSFKWAIIFKSMWWFEIALLAYIFK